MKHIRLPFWITWLAANILGSAGGFLIGWGLLWLVMGTRTDVGSFDLLGLLITAPLTGLGMGTGQWLTLRKGLPRAGWWVPATGLGWLLGLSVDFTLQEMFTSNAWQGFALVGLYQAALQWLILRRRGLIAIIWLPAGVVAWGLAGIAYTSLRPVVDQVEREVWFAPIVSMAGWITTALIFSLLTAWLIRYLVPRKDP